MKSMCDYINRTPQTVENLVRHIEEDSEAFVRKMLERMPSAIYLVGSGTSLNAAYLAQHAMEKVLSIPCFVYPAMTFTDTVHTVVENSCVIGISQAGRSSSTMQALDHARALGCMSVAVSSEEHALIREHADVFLPVRMPLEDIGPKTEGCYCTVVTLVLSMMEVSEKSGRGCREINHKMKQGMLACIDHLPQIVDSTWKWCEEHGEKLSLYDNIIVVGYGDCIPAALEGALKILETVRCCIRSYETEEFMHGIYHSIDRNTMVISIGNAQRHFDRAKRLLSWLKQVKGAYTIMVTGQRTGCDDDFIYPFSEYEFFPAFEYLAFFQTLAQHMAEYRGIDYEAQGDPGFHKTMESYVYE